MHVVPECLPCLLRQSLETARLASADPATHETVLRKVAAALAEASWAVPAPLLGRLVQRIVRETTGDDDPYRDLKERCNRAALAALPRLREAIARAPCPLEAAVRLAIAGNTIDFGAPGGDHTTAVLESVKPLLRRPLAIDHMADFLARASRTRRIAWFADNAGEIVLDRPLIEALGPERVTVVVRGGPILNDATLEDARATGLTELVEVVSSGLDLPGTLIDEASPPVRRLFAEADLVVSKGQGNLETLASHVRDGLFFLLRVKCARLARDLACREGDIVVADATRLSPPRRVAMVDDEDRGAAP